MTDAYVHTVAVLGTVVTVHVVGHGASDGERRTREAAVDRAVGWFEHIEQVCSRFDPRSELRRLSDRVGEPTPVSPMLYEAVKFALAVAEDTAGAFDPTVGASLASLGFDRDHRTGRAAGGALDVERGVSYRDVSLDSARATITLRRPLVLDLGAVAKGLAIDLAARELAPYENFVIDAGGDLYLAGVNAAGEPWTVGIRHPREEGAVVETLRVSNAAVCTSGDYERRNITAGDVHHIIDPRSGAVATTTASVTVVAPSAMVADALATAAFVLGPKAGLGLLERHGAEGVFIAPSLERSATAGMRTA